jgi:hypothetical protein
MNEAVANWELQEPGEQYTLKEISENYGVNCSTLGQQWRRMTASRDEEYFKQQALHPQ